MESVVSILVPISFMACVAAAFIAPGYFRHRDRTQMQETLRVALEKGQTLPAELVTALQSSVAARNIPTREGDLRRAIVLIAVGLGMCGLGFGLWQGIGVYDDGGAYITGWCVAGVGAIPGLIGLAYLILWATKSRPSKV
jgi:hypothetical protein